MIVPSSLTPIRVVVAEHGIDRRGERLGALLVGLFVVTISQAAHSQRPDIVVRAAGGAGAGFVENASFVRLREISVTWKPVTGWAHRRGLARFDLTIAARNLLTFTGYSGLDPEVNYRGQSGLGRGEANTLPLSRTMIIRLDIQR